MKKRICLESFTGIRSLSYVEGIYRTENLSTEEVTPNRGNISWSNARGNLCLDKPVVFDEQSAKEMMGRMAHVDENSFGLDYSIKSRVEDVE